MREIKFRVWDENKKKWNYFSLSNAGYYHEQLNLFLLRGCEFYLFTGLHDLNEKEIWEGDIVKHPNARNPLIVDWIQEELSFKLLRKDGSISLANLSREYEVICNIYEQPGEELGVKDGTL